METGTDMTKLPNEKTLLFLAGTGTEERNRWGKVLRSATLKTRNRTGQAFRKAAASVIRSDCVFGVLYRQMKALISPAQAAVATAHLIARVYYRSL